VTKIDIADIIREKCSLDKKDILFVIDQFVDEILNGVNKGETIEIRGFGTFSREERKGRSVMSPIAKRKVEVPARSVLSFKSSRMTDIIKGA
jgi:nucleoid DNA-binding protein